METQRKESGKLAVPDDIPLKEWPLPPEEWGVVQTQAHHPAATGSATQDRNHEQ